MKVLENLMMLLGVMAVLVWCAGCVFLALRGLQLLGLEADTLPGRAGAAAAALGGLAFAIWTSHLAHGAWRKR